MNDRALVEAVAAENAAFDFGDNAVDAGRGEHRIDDAEGGLRVGEVAGEVVGGVDGGEGAIADVCADGNVLRIGRANDQVGLGIRWHADVLGWDGTKYSRGKRRLSLSRSGVEAE